MICPQLEMLTGIGAMKTLISDVNDVEERLRTNALPNATQVQTSALVRSITGYWYNRVSGYVDYVSLSFRSSSLRWP